MRLCAGYLISRASVKDSPALPTLWPFSQDAQEDAKGAPVVPIVT